MNSPFKIKHKIILGREFDSIRNETILKEFKYRFNKSYADQIEFLSDTKLIVKNAIIRFTPDMNFNFWTGIGKAEVEIARENLKSITIIYTYNYTRIFIAYIIMLCFFIISMIFLEINIDQVIAITGMILSFITIMFLLSFSIVLIRHKTVFNRIIRNIKKGLQHLSM